MNIDTDLSFDLFNFFKGHLMSYESSFIQDIFDDVFLYDLIVSLLDLFNFLNYSNPEVDELLDAGANQPTTELRAPYYKEMQVLLAQDVPMILISEWLGYSPVHKYVKNHPYSEEVVGMCAYGEYTYCWLDN